MPSRNRLFSRLFLALAVATLALQTLVAHQELGGSFPATLWRMSGYFTVLSLLALIAALAAETLGRRPSPRLTGAIALAMLIVATLYHLVLARVWSFEGLAWWTDHAVHSVIPALTLIWWLLRRGRRPGLADLPAWLAWPAGYLVVMMLRGLASGFWPYPFLDPGRSGWPGFAANLAGLLAVALCLALALMTLRRILGR